MRDEALHILQHALGLDDYGRDSKGRFPDNIEEPYRNRYVMAESDDSPQWKLCMEHVEAGRMTRHDQCRSWTGGMSCFCVTEAGLAFVRANSPKPPKRTRSQQRYEQYLDADSSLTFGEWLKARKAVAGA